MRKIILLFVSVCVALISCSTSEKKEQNADKPATDSVYQEEVLDSVQIKVEEIQKSLEHISMAKEVSATINVVPDSLVTPTGVVMQNIVWYKLEIRANGQGALTLILEDGTKKRIPVTDPAMIPAFEAILSKSYKAYTERNGGELHGNDLKAF